MNVTGTQSKTMNVYKRVLPGMLALACENSRFQMGELSPYTSSSRRVRNLHSGYIKKSYW